MTRGSKGSSRKALGCLVSLPVAFLLLLILLAAAIFGTSTTSTADPCIPGSGAGGPVRIPIVGPYTVTSEFGIRWGRLHDGIDLSSGPGGGAQIVAAQGGTVSAVGSDGPTTGRGNYVHVDVGGGVVHGYFHLAAVPPFSVGQIVGTGQLLGIEGNTGHSFGAHLHFQVHTNGVPTNPRDWLTTAGVEVPPLRGSGVGPPAGAATTETSTTGPGGDDPDGGGSVPPPGFPTSLAGYNQEQLINAAWIIKAGQSLRLDAWSIEVGVMTAMGESSLRVLDYGDQAGPDSRGLFQQRDSWGPLEVRMDPTGSSLLFFNALLKVPGYHDMLPTIAAHNVQINANPYHYAIFWPAAVTVTEFLLAQQDLLDAMPATSSGAPSSTGGCKPFLTGLITRQDLSVSSIPRAEELTGFVVEPTWAELEPLDDQYEFDKVAAALDYATAHGQRVRLRVMPDAAQWVKEIGGSEPVVFHDHDADRDITIARFWDSRVQAKWQTMISALAAAFDNHPALGEVNVSGVSAISAEDMLLQLNDRTKDDKTNRENLLAAGYSDSAREDAYLANVAFFQSVWTATPTTMWVHPFTTLDGASMERSTELVESFHAQYPRVTFGHTGADQKVVDGDGGPTDLYEFLRDHVPATGQTRSLNGGFDGNHPLGDLAVVVEKLTTDYRWMAVEIPRGDWQSQLTSEQVAAANYAGAANAAAWATTPEP